MKNLKPWIVRQFAVPVVSFYLHRLMALHRRQPMPVPNLKLKPVESPISARVDRKIDAMALYTSQFKEFFSSRQDCADTLAAYAQRAGRSERALERFWVRTS